MPEPRSETGRFTQRERWAGPVLFCHGCRQWWLGDDCRCTCREGNPRYEEWEVLMHAEPCPNHPNPLACLRRGCPNLRGDPDPLPPIRDLRLAREIRTLMRRLLPGAEPAPSDAATEQAFRRLYDALPPEAPNG